MPYTVMQYMKFAFFLCRLFCLFSGLW